MNYNPDIHHRRSTRLKRYDYSQCGAYFVTICAKNGECIFGDIVDGKLVLNDAGEMVNHWWTELNSKFPDIQTDIFTVMPNHFHGIINVVGADLRVCPDKMNTDDKKGAHTGAPLPRIIQWFKTMTTNKYIVEVKQRNWPPFNGKLWQRNYYDRIIRNDDELDRIREYIINNPLRWHLDRDNPSGNPDQEEQTFWEDFS